MDFTVALAQIKPKLGCLDDNMALAEAAIEKGIAAGADLVVFPELALTGYFLKDLVPEVALRLDSPQIEKLKKLSERISIAIGFVEVSADFRFFNSAVYLEDGEIRHVHRKVYLPTYGLFDEQRYMARGERFRAFDTRFGRIGMLICEDMWHLSAPYILAMDGAMTLICLSSSPGRGVTESEGLGSAAAWQKLTTTTAMFLNCRVFYCNRVGYEDGINFWGGSEAIAPSGEMTDRGALLEEDFVLAKVDGGALRRERIFSPMMRDENLAITVKELKRIDREKDC
ncbi:nitrilase-related carbon-nitrogen hydrolase [Geomonas subterranea]|uniref:Carbon-nitrogen hydrolase n=1 Tax=Geomonas subterranea TaxID=2847989 RepID=A0ABX8LF48_9BACT|nr:MULTISPECIES: nitrilase-related carbon-nitrogen hydrolase [Geomonas]QXE90622.1 carbon-nitrogen hydrolase [Geomonas subterranea]QXM11298.1 carbon-nitrogen hydrolase [Geomonas subterranea]